MFSKIIKTSAIIHFIGLAICAIILLCLPFSDHIRWNLGYFFLWLTILSALPLIFWKVEKYWKAVLIKLYSFIWWLFSFCIIPLLFTIPGSNIMVFPLKKHAETNNYIIRTGYYSFIDLPCCALYKKNGLIEEYIRQYPIYSVDSVCIYDSLGTIILFGEQPSGDIVSTEKAIYIAPINDSLFIQSFPKVNQIESNLRLKNPTIPITNYGKL